MKTGHLLASLGCVAVVSLSAACASNPASQRPASEPVRTTSAALSEDKPNEKTAAEAWAEAKIAKENETAKPRPTGEALDPLSEGAALEAANIPKIEKTDKKLVRSKTRGELDAALSVVKTASTVDEAATKLTARLGKVSWTENGSKRIWVALEGNRCHRLVLEADGSVNVETVAKSDVIRLTATVRQDPCTGEIERGGAH